MPKKGDFFYWAYTTVRNAALTLIRDKKNKLTFELNENNGDTVINNPFKQLEWKRHLLLPRSTSHKYQVRLQSVLHGGLFL